MLALSGIEQAIKLITLSFPCATDPGVSPNTRRRPVPHVTEDHNQCFVWGSLCGVARAGVAHGQLWSDTDCVGNIATLVSPFNDDFQCQASFF